MESSGEKLSRLEKRLMQLEMFLGITPDSENLLHPKALRQFIQSRTEKTAIELLRDELHAFVYAHYDQGTQASLMAMVISVLAILLSKQTTEAEKAAADTRLDELMLKILPAWEWVEKILLHYFTVEEQIIINGAYVKPDFMQFIDHDPRASLKELVLTKGE